jgi:hypothetical protein
MSVLHRVDVSLSHLGPFEPPSAYPFIPAHGRDERVGVPPTDIRMTPCR